MADAERIFISWSGQQSKEVAKRLQSALKIASDSFVPFVSDIDIAGGTRGLNVIADELAQSRVAILVVNAHNIERPWLNFEAGAIAAKIDDPQKRVIPLLVNMQPGDIPSASPLRQFQAREATHEDLLRVLDELSRALLLDSSVVRARCEARLEDLAQYVASLALNEAGDPSTERSEKDMLREVVLELRDLTRNLPETIASAVSSATGGAEHRRSPGQREAERMFMQLGRVLDVDFVIRLRGEMTLEVAVTKVPSFALRGMGPTDFLSSLDRFLDELSAMTAFSFVLDPRTLDQFISSRTLSRSELKVDGTRPTPGEKD